MSKNITWGPGFDAKTLVNKGVIKCMDPNTGLDEGISKECKMPVMKAGT